MQNKLDAKTPRNLEKLDLLDRKILYELDRNSRQTFKELGKRVRATKETVGFRVKRLVSNGYVLRFNTVIDISNLNRFYYKILYRFHHTDSSIEKQIVEFMQQNSSTAYLASTQGRYDLVLLLLVKDVRGLYHFLVPFREKFGEYVLEQEIVTLPSANRFNFRFFYPQGELLHTRFAEELRTPDIDEKDYVLIAELANDSRIKLVELAKKIGLDINAVKYRIRKLKNAGIIKTHTLALDFNKFGFQHVQVYYSLKNHNSIEKIVKFASQLPSTIFANIMLGKYDISIEFAVKDLDELNATLAKIKDHFSKEITSQDTFFLKEHGINWFPG